MRRAEDWILAIGVSFFCIAAAQPMPLAPCQQAKPNLTIPVAVDLAFTAAHVAAAATTATTAAPSGQALRYDPPRSARLPLSLQCAYRCR